MITVNIKECKEALIQCFKNRLVPFVQSSPGCSKSSIAKQIADEKKLKLIDLRLSQLDPVELNGLPKITDIATWIPFDVFPLENTPIPNGYKGFLLLLDEFNSAPLSVQSSAYRLCLDREVGQHKLHDKCFIMCAGNKTSDNAITNRLSTAMQSRLIHLFLEVENKEWLDWARDNDIDYRVISYIEFKPNSLFNFNPTHNDCTFATLRTWEFVSKLIKGIQEPMLALICGAIGEATGREFYSYCQIFQDLPTREDIINKPLDVVVPNEPSTLYAVYGLLYDIATEDSLDSIMKYLGRLPVEFQYLTGKTILKKNPKFQTKMKDWISKFSKELLLDE